MRGSNNTLEIKGDGTAKSYGDVIRLYVGDRTKAKKWTNVELTVYGKRVSEMSGAGSAVGFEFQTRTDDGHTSSTALNAAGLPLQCDGKAYGFSFRTDGRALVEKELKHPTTTSQVAKNVWSGGAFPKSQWVGMKLIVYSVDNGQHVKQEVWRDLTDGAGGGTWVKVLENTDAGGWAISSTTAASCKIPADYIITAAQPLVILRNDHDLRSSGTRRSRSARSSRRARARSSRHRSPADPRCAGLPRLALPRPVHGRRARARVPHEERPHHLVVLVLDDVAVPDEQAGQVEAAP